MKRSLNRRHLLQAAAALAVAPAAAKGKNPMSTDADPNHPPIVDTHQHLWDLERFRLPWVKGSDKLNRSFVMKDYLDATAGLNIAKTVYMEVDVAPEQQLLEAEYVIDLCRRDDNPMVAAVISGRPASPEFKAYISRFKGSPYIKGIRQVLHAETTPPGYCLNAEFVKAIRLLGDLGMSFDLCMRSPELPDGAKLVDQCPHTRFILDHCGNANVQAADRTQWERDIAEVAKRKNVVCKVSGIVASAKPGAWKPEDLKPIVQHVLKVFGPDRVMFGGDWPVCMLAASYREWVEALRWIVRDESLENRRKLFGRNAEHFYHLS